MRITKHTFYAFLMGSATARKRVIIVFVNWGILLLVLGVGLAATLFAALWPYLNPESPIWAQQRLAELVRTWERVRDLEAQVTLLRPGEPRLRVRFLYLAGAAMRLELQEPPELAGEVYTLRPVEGGWLFVHFRPRLDLGLEARFSLAELETLLSPPVWGKGEVRWLNEAAFVLRGWSGPFQEAEVYLEGELRLPKRVILREQGGAFVELQIAWVAVNQGLGLRELLILDPLPSRWIRIPSLPASGA
ncbi:MAG: hypothetical protein NZ651_07035 [Candidatus Bipolaricaulota bacterium]|nr:hypothetical protein [Candidatus Bipolaricaulota bacterium]MDW8127507.1 hypothetical protein [Candidatus Bipolaricaulota bacterium]